MFLTAAAVSCLSLAAANSRLPPAIIVSILAVEGGKVGTASPNEDGSSDFGPGQINSIWVPEVARTVGIDPVEAQRRLQWDECFNIRVTAAILRREIDLAGGDFWTGVAHYHSHEPREGQSYMVKVIEAARLLFGSKVFAKR